MEAAIWRGGGAITPLSSHWTPERVVLLEFPSREDVGRWFQSPEYRAIAPLRERSTTCKAIIVDGEESTSTLCESGSEAISGPETGGRPGKATSYPFSQNG